MRLTLPSRGRATSGFASCRPPLMSNVRARVQRMKAVLSWKGCVESKRCLPFTAVPGRPSTRPANHRAARGSSSPALAWGVRRTRGQRAVGCASPSSFTSLCMRRGSVERSRQSRYARSSSYRLFNGSWATNSTTVLLRWSGAALCRPCGVPQRLGCWSVQAPAIARAARCSAVWLANTTGWPA